MESFNKREIEYSAIKGERKNMRQEGLDEMGDGKAE